ncbi:MAG TPA: helix-turn-helix transcriptional regulator [Caulobacter sp.]|nr:helix-turn-helix transcriptional regulator [Caulobacter sp.]
MKTLSLSRGRLASELGVDKSVVARWATGVVSPSEHNLARLTELVAQRRPGFSMLHWDATTEALLAFMGGMATASIAQPLAADLVGLPIPGLDEARAVAQRRQSVFEGFWRTVRASLIVPGRLVHDHGLVRRNANGLLEFWLGSSGARFEGWMLPLQGQVFVVLSDLARDTQVYAMLSAVGLPRGEMFDGILLAPALDVARTPTAVPVIVERIGELSGDVEADNARCRELQAQDASADESLISPELKAHLLRDVGPLAQTSAIKLEWLRRAATT